MWPWAGAEPIMLEDVEVEEIDAEPLGRSR
jgi:hypothetical protein